MITMQKATAGIDTKATADGTRFATSCTECQRRKQKCSREWPCNHCKSRKVSHLCQFGSKRSPGSNNEGARGSRRTKQAPVGTEEDSIVRVDDDVDGLKVWGYMPSHHHYNLKYDSTLELPNTHKAERSGEVQAALRALPARSLTDSLVHNFLYSANYRYYAIYPPTFADEYAQWWANRMNGKPLLPQFTSLLLRVCACSAQYLSPTLQKELEFELSESVQILTERLHGAAAELARTIPPGTGGLSHVQQLFLTCAWMKSEAQLVESWHALGAAIREAQEQGYHKVSEIEGLCEYDLEMRTRMWCLLNIWDWQMSSWLSRPFIIDRSKNIFDLPNLRLEDSNLDPGLPSPFAHMRWQGLLVRNLCLKISGPPSPGQILTIQNEITEWMISLPAVFRVTNPDTSLDDKHPWLVQQRLQLHAVIYMVKLDPVKCYLTRSPGQESLDPDVSNHEDYFRKLGVDCCLTLIKYAQALYDCEYPINNKFHFIVFCLFDTATIMCSAIIHDVNRDLPKRPEVVEAIGDSIRMLKTLSISKIGAISHVFVSKLVKTVPLRDHEQASLEFRSSKKPKSQSFSSASSATGSPSSSDSSTSVLRRMPPEPVSQSDVASSLPVAPTIENTAAVTFPADSLEAPVAGAEPSEGFGGIDLGGLESLWNYDSLNIDPSVWDPSSFPFDDAALMNPPGFGEYQY